MAEVQAQVEMQQRQAEQKQRTAWKQVLEVHKDVVAKLEAKNAELRTALDAAWAARRTTDAIDLQDPAEGLVALRVSRSSSVSSVSGEALARRTPEGFPGWASVLTSQALELHVIADDDSERMVIHTAVLERSPYFQVRLARRWRDTQSDAMPLRLPPGCSCTAAKLVFQQLYSEEQIDSSSFSASLAFIRRGDAALAIGASLIAEMLLLDELAAQLTRVAQAVLISPEEVAELKARFVALPGMLTTACQAVQKAPAAQLRAGDLAKMLESSASCKHAWPKAAAVLSAAADAGCAETCMEAVITALEALPFIEQDPNRLTGCIHASKGAFAWLWNLVEEHVLVPRAFAPAGTSPRCGGSSEEGEKSLIVFFTSIAKAQEMHTNRRCPSENQTFDNSAELLQEAFGAYLEHLAAGRTCRDLQRAFQLGASKFGCSAASHRSHSCTIAYPNILYFGSWSAKLLPRLLRTITDCRPMLISTLLELPPEDLAELMDDDLLEALGPDAAEVCNLFVRQPNVLAKWASASRLLTLPLLAQRRLCSCLAPSLGSLAPEVAEVVTQVLAGRSHQKECETSSSNLHLKQMRAWRVVAIPIGKSPVLLIVFAMFCILALPTLLRIVLGKSLDDVDW